jgi:tape measure domain-containing protein
MANDLNVIINLLANSKGLEAGYKNAAISQVALNRELNRGNTVATTATRGLNGLEKQANGLGRTMQNVGRYAATAFGFFAVQRAAAGVKNVLADYQDFETRLKFLSGTTDVFTQNMEFLDRLSQDHGKSILDLGQGYGNVAALIRGGTLDMQQGQAITVGLSNAQSALGATSAQLGLVMYGLGQSLSQPKVQAQEFNQVTEPLPGLMQELTKAAGLTTGSYRDLVIAGKITSKQFSQDLIKALGSYDGAAKANIKNIHAQEVALSNMRVKAVEAFSDPISNVYGDLLDTTSSGLKVLADNAETVTDTLGVLVTVGLLRGAAALTNYSVATVQSTVANVAKINADRTLAASTLAAAKTQAAYTVQLQLGAQRQLAAAASDNARSVAITNLALRNGQAVAAQNALTVATARYVATASAAMTVVKGSLALLGGLPGVILLSGYALYSYASATDDAAEKTDTLKDRIYDLTDAFDGLNNASVRNDIRKNTREALTLNDQILALSKTRQKYFNYRANTSDPRTYALHTRTINGLTGSINQLSEKRAVLLNANVKLANTEDNLNKLKYTAVSQGRAEIDGAIALTAARADQEKQANALLNNLKQQNALYGNVTHEAKIRYDLESGKLTAINDQLREKLILEAQQLDALNKQKAFQQNFERVATSLKTPTENEQSTNKNNLGVLNQALIETPESDVEKRAQINLLLEAEQRRHNEAVNKINQKGKTDFDAMWGESFDRFASGIGDATADALFESSNLGDGIRNVVSNVGRQMVSTLIEIGVKRLALAAINATANTAEAATASAAGVATGATITAAMAPAAAATTLATAGVNGVGSIATIGAVGAAMAAMFAGLFDNGGDIRRGQFGIVGEYGPEIVNGPARITSRADTAKILSQKRDNGQGGGETLMITVNDNKVINVSGSSEEQQAQLYTALEDNNRRLVAQIAKDTGRGQGPLYNAMRRVG